MKNIYYTIIILGLVLSCNETNNQKPQSIKLNYSNWDTKTFEFINSNCLDSLENANFFLKNNLNIQLDKDHKITNYKEYINYYINSRKSLFNFINSNEIINDKLIKSKKILIKEEYANDYVNYRYVINIDDDFFYSFDQNEDKSFNYKSLSESERSSYLSNWLKGDFGCYTDFSTIFNSLTIITELTFPDKTNKNLKTEIKSVNIKYVNY